jgi:hypothetical protein
LRFDVAADGFARHIPCGGSEIRASPERRESLQLRKLFSEFMRSKPLHFLDDFGGRSRRVNPYEQVDVFGLYRQLKYLPSLLFALLVDKPLALCRHIPHENRLPPLRAKDEVIHDKMNPMLVFDVIHSVDIIHLINRISKGLGIGPRLRRAKASLAVGGRETAPNHPLKQGGLRRV